MRHLDTPWTRLYKPALLGALVAAVVLVGEARAEVVSGASIPDGSDKVGENRYRARDDWEAVLKYYRSVYPKSSYPWKQVVNQPGVKAVHIQNPSGKNFEGLNIYQHNDEVRIYVIAIVDPKAPKKRDPKKK